MAQAVAIHWFRRDLRLQDNHALSLAQGSGLPVVCVFIFDKTILNALPSKADARVQFIVECLTRINNDLVLAGSALHVEFSTPEAAWMNILKKFAVKKVFANDDYEPEAIERDKKIKNMLNAVGIDFALCKDQVIFEKLECAKDDGLPYTVFTPYSRKWLKQLTDQDTKHFVVQLTAEKFLPLKPQLPLLKDLGFQECNITFPERKISKALLLKYKEERNRPDLDSTSRLGIHLRFGTLSVRKAVEAARIAPAWLNELIWREFFMMILSQFPKSVNEPVRNKGLEWREDAKDFEHWKRGCTGYPMVDAGMRQLNESGFMHNRVRMVTASFLTKHLMLNWKLGERYFAEKLLDFELSSNVGNWQWVAGTGFDAAPYFRIFNPEIQAKKFDPEKKYIRRWVPEFETSSYPEPIINHEVARRRALANYEKFKRG